MKTIIAGSRDFIDYNVFDEVMKVTSAEQKITEVVSGTAHGVDLMGERWANENNKPVKRFPADWNKYGKAAGPIRNKQMAEYGERLIIIWDGKSRGTKNMLYTFGELKGWDNVIIYIYPTNSYILTNGIPPYDLLGA